MESEASLPAPLVRWVDTLRDRGLADLADLLVRLLQVWGFVGGLAVDALSGAPFGAVTLSLIAAGGLSGLGQATVVRARFLFPSAAAFLATILSSIIFLLVLEVSGQPLPWWDALLRVAMPSALLNAVLMPLVFLLMSALHSWLRRDEIEW